MSEMSQMWMKAVWKLSKICYNPTIVVIVEDNYVMELMMSSVMNEFLNWNIHHMQLTSCLNVKSVGASLKL